MSSPRKLRTPAEVAGGTAEERAAWMRATVAHLRAVADACHTAGVPGWQAIGMAARQLQGVEAAWRGEGACCDRARVGRACGCAVALPGGEG